MQKRSRLWLVAALALFVAAGWLMRGKPPPPAKPKHSPADFPRRMRPSEYERQKARAVALPHKPDPAAPEAPRTRDPFLAALPPIGPKSKTAVVFEAAAIQAMPVGKMFLRCLERRGRTEKLEQTTGLRPESLERVAVADDLLVLGGDFGKAKWAEFTKGGEGERRGEHATLYSMSDRRGEHTIARWDDQFVLLGDSREAVEAAIDRMEGRAPAEPAIRDDEAYGEIYGVVGVEAIGKILEREQPELAERLQRAAERVELHVDATEDVLMVADLNGSDAAQLNDLGKSLGGAMSVGRMSAKADGNDDLAELLDAARVARYGDAWRVEAALPLAMIEKALGPCAREGDAGTDE